MSEKEFPPSLDQILSSVQEQVMYLGNRHNPWLLNHVLDVFTHAKRLSRQYSPLYPDVVALGALLHDIGKLSGHFKDHEVYAANWAIEQLPQYGYPEDKTKIVALICKRHDKIHCSNPTLEELLVRTADASAHFSNESFYSDIYTELCQFMPEEKARKKIQDKLHIDFNHKLAFDTERQKFRARYTELLKQY
jgi:putative nucleotidyltransferase with HDIG domain